jgi:plastocyanin
MKSPRESTRTTRALTTALLFAAFATGTLQAREWQAWIGAQSRDLGSQAVAFLPNELWIHANDSIRWTLTSTEIHTVTFLIPGPPGQLGQVRQPLFGAWDQQIGCPRSTPDGASFDGTNCVNSGVMGAFDTIVGPQSYSVKFPNGGNFKFVCFVHADMNGTVHVLDPSQQLPYDQEFYSREAQTDAAALVSEAAGLAIRGTRENHDGGPAVKITAGIGEIVTMSGAGSQAAFLFRFLRDVIVVRVGDTVEWTSLDASVGHTVTFGTEPTDPRPPSANVTPTPDGARETVISSPGDSANSGLLILAFQDRPNLGQSPLGVTRFRVTFKSAGTFHYICALHDNLGMKGTVIVH